MILGKNYIYVEIPHTASEWVAEILLRQCGGSEVTPKYDPLVEPVDNSTVFTTILKPYRRMGLMYSYHALNPEPDSFVEWYEWIKSRGDDPWYITRPYNFWTHNCDRVLKVERIEDQLTKFLKELGYKITIEEELDLEPQYKLTPRDIDFIKKERHDDFGPHGYTMNLRG